MGEQNLGVLTLTSFYFTPPGSSVTSESPSAVKVKRRTGQRRGEEEGESLTYQPLLFPNMKGDKDSD